MAHSPNICKYIMLSMMILGLRQPRYDIYVYLSPLIETMRMKFLQKTKLENKFMNARTITRLFSLRTRDMSERKPTLLSALNSSLTLCMLETRKNKII